jgi:hypothetical protein
MASAAWLLADGLWVCGHLRAAGLATRALVLTMYDYDVTVLAALRAGASATHSRSRTGRDRPRRTVVARGEALFGAGIAARMLQHFGCAATSSPFPELTERETEVLHGPELVSSRQADLARAAEPDGRGLPSHSDIWGDRSQGGGAGSSGARVARGADHQVAGVWPGGRHRVSHFDRLSRSVLDFATLLEHAKAEGWNIVILDLGLDLYTPSGEFGATFLMSAAQLDRRLISNQGGPGSCQS